MLTKDAVLLKIHRRYGKDESFKYLLDKIKKIGFENGELKSENAELAKEKTDLKSANNSLKLYLKQKEKKHPKIVEAEWNKDAFINELQETIVEKNNRLAKHKKEMEEWRYKYFDLLAKFEKQKNSLQK